MRHVTQARRDRAGAALSARRGSSVAYRAVALELAPLFAAQATTKDGPVVPSPELEALLGRLLDEARAAWPGIALPVPAFLAHLAERLPQDVEATAALATVHASDLYLACACAAGDVQAVALFEDRFMASVARFLVGIDDRPVEVDEVKQMLRMRLLVAEPGQAPHIAEYAGRGPLGAWLRRAAVRLLLARRRARSSEGPLVPEAVSLPSAVPDPELLYLKVRYGPDLDAAFREALGALSERERTLLQLYFVNGLTADTLAAMYRVAESTVRRWLAESRAHIVDETRRRLAIRLDISDADCQSLVAVLQSQLDLSVLKLLKENDEKG